MIDVFAIAADVARRRGVDPGRISVIELNRSGPAQTAVALLAFEDGAGEPVAFIKATTDAARAVTLDREFQNLARLAGGDEDFRRTVPAPLYRETRGSLTVLAESAQSGTRIKDFPPDEYFSSKRFRAHYERCARWLGRFDATLGGDRKPLAISDAKDEVQRYRRSHRVSPELDRLLTEALQALATTEIPGVPSHGDFCTANVIVRPDGGLFVIDWEYPLDPTWPLADLLYFTSSTWCVPYRKGADAVEQNFRRLFFEPHGFSELIRAAAADCARRLNLATQLLLPLSVLCWTVFANRKRRELSEGVRRESGHLPLILIRDNACTNLEVLAAGRDRYLPGSAAPR